MPPDEEIYLRKMIRKDIRELIKMERMAEYKGETTDSDMDSDDANIDRRMEDKVMFGSDSEKDIDEFVINKFKQQIADGDIEYASEDDEGEYYEEGEEEMEYMDEMGEDEHSELAFEDAEKKLN